MSLVLISSFVLCFVIASIALIQYFVYRYPLLTSHSIDRCKFEFTELEFTRKKRFYFFIVITLFSLLWILNVLIPGEYRHTDSVAYLNSTIFPVLYSGRFFPLGHLEFNLFSLKFFDGNVFMLFLLPFIQGVICFVVIFSVLPLKKPLLRLVVTIAIFMSSLSVPFSNLIIPERNQIFFFLLFLYFFMKGEGLHLRIAIFFASISFFYKEPTFIMYGFLSLGSVVYYLINKKIRWGEIISLKMILERMSLEVSLLLMCFFYMLGYFLFAVLYQDLSSTYGFAKNFDYSDLVYKMPYVLMLIICLPMFYLNGVKSKNSYWSWLLFVGSFGYTCSLLYLKVPVKEYYYNISNLMISISAVYLIVDLMERKSSGVK